MRTALRRKSTAMAQAQPLRIIPRKSSSRTTNHTKSVTRHHRGMAFVVHSCSFAVLASPFLCFLCFVVSLTSPLGALGVFARICQELS